MHTPWKQCKIIGLVAIGSLCASNLLMAQGSFSAPVQNSFTLSFDDADPGSPGPVDFVADRFTEDFDDSYAGETASWGSFGGGPDSITADFVQNIGPNGTGDTAARLTVTDATPGGYFARLLWQVKGLRLGNASGGTASGDEPIPDFNNNLRVTVPVRTNIPGARFRINFDTGSGVSAGRFDNGTPDGGSFVQGNLPGFVENFGSGSRVLKIGPSSDEIGELPINTWGTQTLVGGFPVALDEAPSDINLWRNADFGPFFFRGPRSFNLTRVGVTFPGGGVPGELLVSEWTMTGDDVLKYHMADFNTDELVDAADIDLLYEAIAALELNDSLPPVPDNNFNGRLDFEPVFGVNQIPFLDVTLPEKFSITTTDNELNFDDVVELVEGIMQTRFGDANLDGNVDIDDFNIWNSNRFTTGGWADGDFNGDGAIDISDFNVWNQNKFFTASAVTAVPEPASAGVGLMAFVALVAARHWRRAARGVEVAERSIA